MSVTKYEVFFDHIESCDGCSWVTGELCDVGKTLLHASAKRAAQILAPIPTVLPRPKVQA